jgi:hypothetical protein
MRPGGSADAFRPLQTRSRRAGGGLPSYVKSTERGKVGLGDIPHGWVASDFIGAALDLCAYEREPDHAMVLGAGVPLVRVSVHRDHSDRSIVITGIGGS